MTGKPEQSAAAPRDERAPGGVGKFFLHLLIYAACDAVWTIAIGLMLPDNDAEPFATLMVNAYAGVAMVLAFLTSRVFVPKKLQTVWIIGALAPLAMLAAFGISLLFSK